MASDSVHSWPLPADVAAVFEDILLALRRTAETHYGSRLVALAVFGSVARRTMRSDSDIDVLVVADALPPGRMRRVYDFDPVEAQMASLLRAAESHGVFTRLSPVFKTPGEVAARSPLMLDMTQDARILFDRDGFLRGQLDALARRLRELGSRRIFVDGGWWWDLKPDFKPGEVFSI
jgi:predicted nucleotidyltransferase